MSLLLAAGCEASQQRSRQPRAPGRRSAAALLVALLCTGLSVPAAAEREVERPRSRPQIDALLVRVGALVPLFDRRGPSARRDFRAYLARNPAVAAIYAEERERETVRVATRNIALSLGTALAVLGSALAVDWRTAMPAAIALVQAYNQSENRSSKIMKARGTTLTRAARMAQRSPNVEPPDIDRFLAAGFVRKGDIGRIHRTSRARPSREGPARARPARSRAR